MSAFIGKVWLDKAVVKLYVDIVIYFVFLGRDE